MCDQSQTHRHAHFGRYVAVSKSFFRLGSEAVAGVLGGAVVFYLGATNIVSGQFFIWNFKYC